MQDERADDRRQALRHAERHGRATRGPVGTSRAFENHGFYRHYDVAGDGRVLDFTGATERARVEFNPDGRTQTIMWEWKPKDAGCRCATGRPAGRIEPTAQRRTWYASFTKNPSFRRCSRDQLNSASVSSELP